MTFEALFHGGVAAADHDDLLAAIEEPVAGGAGADAETLEMFLAGQAQPFRLRAGGKDQRIGGVGGAAVGLGHEGPRRKIDPGDEVAHNLGPHGAGVLLHPHHQVGAHDMGVTRPVLDFGRDGQLPAGLHPLDEDRVQHGPGGIDRCSISGRPGPDDQDPRMAGGHGKPRKAGCAI